MTTEGVGANRINQMFYPMIFSGLMVGLYRYRMVLFVDMALLIILVAAILQMTSCMALNAPFTAFQPELPRREYLTDKRKKIQARIQLLQLTTGWLMIPMALSFLVHSTARARSLCEMAIVALIVIPAAMLAYCHGRSRIRKHLRSHLEDVDLELYELSAKAALEAVRENSIMPRLSSFLSNGLSRTADGGMQVSET